MFTKRRLLLVILQIAFLVSIADAATVHGSIYAWSDFDKPLKNAIVEVNSTPTQSKVATDGSYSFELPQGSYVIKARYYQDNMLEYTAEEEIQIDSEGNFTIDLLLFPPTEPGYEFPGEINLADIKEEEKLNNYYILVLILLFSAVLIFYWIKRKKTVVDEPVTPVTSETTGKELPDDLQEIYSQILKKGGRTTQKELRKELKCSEAKVSLMIADLEERGLIKKIKRGRANIIIAEQSFPKS